MATQAQATVIRAPILFTAIFWDYLKENAQEEYINKTLLIQHYITYRDTRPDGKIQPERKAYKDLDHSIKECEALYGKAEVTSLLNDADKHFEAFTCHSRVGN